MPNMVLTFGVNNGSNTDSQATTLTASGSSYVEESITNAQTDLQVVYTLDVSACVLLYMVSNQAITIETNSGSSPANTFVLAANIPYVYRNDDGMAFRDTAEAAVTTDITSLFITNSSGSTATLKIWTLVDTTP